MSMIVMTAPLWGLRHQCLLQRIIRLLSTGMLPGGQVMISKRFIKFVSSS